MLGVKSEKKNSRDQIKKYKSLIERNITEGHR